MRSKRTAFTLVELLVTIVGASVVIAGLASVVVQMLSDQRDIAVAREQAYARVHASGEIAWTLKQAGRRGIRQLFSPNVSAVDDPNLPLFSPPATFPGFDDTGPGGGVAWDPALVAAGRSYPAATQARGVITYAIENYDHPEAIDTNGDGYEDTLANLDPTRARTGLIYQYDSVVYRFERLMSDLGMIRTAPTGKDPGDPENLTDRSFSGFNSYTSGALATWINDAANRAQSEVLAVGVDRFEVNYVRDTRDPDARNGTPTNRWSIRWNLVFYKPSR